MINKNIPIGEVLKEYGYITQQQLDQALINQKKSGKRLGEVLQEMEYVTEKQVLQALSKRLQLKLIDITNVSADIMAVQLIPKQLAEKYQMLPLKANEQIITVAVNDPLNFYAQEDIRQLTERQLEIVLCERAPLKEAIEHYYSDVSVQDATRRANMESVSAIEEIDIDEGDGDAPIIKLLNSLIERAYNIGASDIHVEPFEDKTSVRVRIDGTIVDYVTLQRSVHPSLIARIKILSDLDIAERRLPQDGHFRYKLPNEQINIRVSVIPTVFGETAVLRLLSNTGNIDYADSFGMTDENYRKILKMLMSPNGIIYMTGPTGSGKTTTLYMLLEYLSKKQVNICTIEDPVEKNLARINQTQVNNVAGLTFESGMRSLLRQDPDIIMVGETRDNETAAISVRAAITGHLVFSTLHTNNAVASIVRLEDMGVEPYLIANSLVGLVAQRLMRKVCPYCAEQVTVTPEQRYLLGDDIDTVMQAKGCSRCNNTGYSGRIAIHEIVGIDKSMRAMISKGSTTEEIEQYAIKTQGMKLLKDSGMDLVKKGITTVEELLKVSYYS